MKPTDVKPCRRRPRAVGRWVSMVGASSGLGALLVWSLAAGCGGQTSRGPVIGSQTHFLRSCEGVCGGGLQCVCGVCTLPCEESRQCGGLSGVASCEAVRADCSQAAASCAVECVGDADCSEFGSGFRCQRGQCRGPLLATEELAPLRQALVGEACIQDDELFPDFSGTSASEVNIAIGHAACGGEEGVCLSNGFRGRVTCPDGQPQAGGSCRTPLGEPVSVPVEPQDPLRPAATSVYCTCACDGSDPSCTCPEGMSCEQVFSSGSGALDIPLSYCVYPELASLPQDEPMERPQGPDEPLSPPAL